MPAVQLGQATLTPQSWVILYRSVSIFLSETCSEISQSQLVEFGLSQSNFDRFVELEMLEIAVSLKCLKYVISSATGEISRLGLTPPYRCKRSMLVDRKEYSALRLISCPLPACGQRWCKDCGKVVDDSTTKHRCKDKTLNRVMKKKGWRYCPGLCSLSALF